MQKDAKKIFKFVSLSILFLFILIYAFFRSKDLLFGVKIKDINIINGATFTTSVLDISGNAKNAVNLTLNGREISVDQQGNWNETIALLPGYNVIEIVAKDKFGYSDEENYQLIYKAPVIPEEVLEEPTTPESQAPTEEITPAQQ